MALLAGLCTNFGLCAKADSQEVQNAPEGLDFVCSECRRRLKPVGTEPARRPGRSPVGIWAFIVVAAVIGGAIVLLRSRPNSAPTEPVSSPVQSNVILRLSGSNTIGAQLAPDLVSAWLAQKGASDLRRKQAADEVTLVQGTLSGKVVAVSVSARGSATAFRDLAVDGFDVGMASRAIKPAEADALRARGLGDLQSNAQERVLGLDGVAVIVNNANSTDSLTREQLADIFSGTGASLDWHVYARDDKSGTYDTFKDRVLGSRALISSAKRFEDSRALVSAVSHDPNGIGFVGLPYAVGVKTVAVAEEGTRALQPNTITVRTEAYPLSRRLYLYLPQNAKPEAVQFVQFALSDAGQEIVEKDGFVGQKVEAIQKQQAPAEAPKAYADLARRGERLSVDFRFHLGSSDLDSKAMDDVGRVVSLVDEQYRNRGLVLAGFADATGAAAQNLRLSKERAEAVAARMETEGLKPVAILGFGDALPVADNTTPEGREKNRRVEVWVK